MLKPVRVLLLAALLAPSALMAQTLAATPPMGWNSWNLFAGRVTDKDVRAAADAMVTSGMKDAGYIYVNIDDTWQGQRDAGRLRSFQGTEDRHLLGARANNLREV
jgi:alpha-galactosidase